MKSKYITSAILVGVLAVFSAATFAAGAQRAPLYRLNRVQRTTLQSLAASTRAQIAQVKATPNLSVAAKAQRITALITTMQAQNRAALNPAQAKLWDEQQARAAALNTLHLSITQKVQAQLIDEAADQRSAAVLSNPKLTPPQREKLIAQILKGAQKAKAGVYTQAQAKAIEKREGHANLTATQKVRIRILKRNAGAQTIAVLSNPSLNRGQKNAQLALARKQREAEINSILTKTH